MKIREFVKRFKESKRMRNRTFVEVKCDNCEEIKETTLSNFNSSKHLPQWFCKNCSRLSSVRGIKQYKGTPIHNSFAGAKQRCNYSKHISYHRYGGRGIKFEWNSFEEFRIDMEPTWFDGATIERINIDGNYNKNNCKWATYAEQARNTSRNKNTINRVEEIREMYRKGKYTQKELAKLFNESQGNISNMITGKIWKIL